MNWVLVLYIFATPWAKGDSVSVTSIPMSSEAACQAAGKKAAVLVKDSVLKGLGFVCLEGGAK